MMAKKMSIVLMALIVMISFVANAESPRKAWEKTVTLPNGEVILDMSGEWNVVYEFYGVFSWVETSKDILTITQEGPEFSAIKQIGSQFVPKGSKTIKGVLDKNGFKEVYFYIGSRAMDGTYEWTESKWEINENGNKVMLDAGERAKATLTRK